MSDLATRRLVSSSPEHTGEMLYALLEQSRDCIKVIGPDGRLDFMNRNGRGVMEVEDFSELRGNFWWELWPEESASLVRGSVDQARAGASSEFEAFCPTAKGSPRWWHVSVSPVVDEAGELSSIVSISRDVTEQVRAREASVVFAQELRHKLRNAYTVASAIALQSARGNPDKTEFANGLAKRLADVSAAQARLIDLQTDTIGLPDLMDTIIGAQAADGAIAVECDEDVVLDGDVARAVALVLGELMTNSLKHGALARGEPVSVAAQRQGEMVEIRWTEATRFDPAALHAPGSGSGLSLMTRMAKSHRGSLTLDWRDDRLDARLELPAI